MNDETTTTITIERPLPWGDTTGDDCQEIEVEIQGADIGGEPMTRDHPGSNDEVELHEVVGGEIMIGTKLTRDLDLGDLTEAEIAEAEQQMLENYEGFDDDRDYDDSDRYERY